MESGAAPLYDVRATDMMCAISPFSFYARQSAGTPVATFDARVGFAVWAALSHPDVYRVGVEEPNQPIARL